jgi:hypothetical protein
MPEFSGNQHADENRRHPLDQHAHAVRAPTTLVEFNA